MLRFAHVREETDSGTNRKMPATDSFLLLPNRCSRPAVIFFVGADSMNSHRSLPPVTVQ